ncbi:MAG TPA: sterol desaturase family protein [Daejeonella sp.]|nr:sterol desaturase family protein [Daejeonella sp.]
MNLQNFIGEAGLWSVFGAPKISFDEIYQLEKSSPNLLVYSLPAVAVFTLLEFVFSYRDGKAPNYEIRETIGSVFIGLGNLVISMGLKIVLLYGAIWVYNLTPWRMELNWWLLIPCFVVYDFCSFWAHRVSHYCRFFWATHVVHHSAEHYNLTVSFRQSWVQHLKLVFFFPLIMMGFHPVIFFVANQLSVLYQFWVHTESIKKLHPFIEKYFGTPSNHRVHHGSQGKYLDRNFGATFMIWDHLFGSFQYEEEKPIYGITTGVQSKINPFILNFHEYRDMYQDVKQARGIGQKLYFVFASPAKISKYKQKQILVTAAVSPENAVK